MNFVAKIQTLLVNGTLTRQQADAIAKSEGIADKTVQKELTELAIVLTAREIALQPLPLQARFSQIVALYKGQVNLAHRTSQSIMLQQYSTPAPIAFMAGEYVKHGISENYQILEPSAGNGLLTVAFPAKNVLVNEIDELRNKNLQVQGYMKVMRVDGTTNLARLYEFESLFDGIVTNPPFGTMDKPLIVGEYKINHLDHVMCIRALDCMKDNGRAAMIIGGHTGYDDKGRVQAGKNRIFLTYLYSHYNVEDIINIDGSLYSRQGTSFNVRLILINGRKAKPEGYPPLKTDDANPITDFESLYERIMLHFGEAKAKPKTEVKPFNLMVYGKYKDENYKAMSLAKMEQVSNLVYASLIPNTRIDEIEKYLQEASDKNTNWSFQIRVAGKGKVLRTIEPTTDKPKSEPFDVKEPDGFFYNGLIYVLDESGNYFPIGTSQKSIRNAIHRSRMWQHIHNKLATPWYKNDDKPKRLRIAKAKAKALILIQSQMSTLGNTSDFGEVFTQFKGKPKLAIKHLIKVKQGEAVNALYREDIGFIDIVWGENDPKTNKGFGLKHIIEKHGNEIEQLGFKVEDFIPIVVQFGEYNKKVSENGRYAFEGKMFRFIIEPHYKGRKKQWLLTAFDLRKKPKK